MKKFRSSAGFTLVEILSAMAILVVMVMLMGRLYRDCVNMWDLGTRRAFDNSEARAILDFISRDLASAVADDVLGFRLESEQKVVFGTTSANGWNNDALWFVSLNNDPENPAFGSPRAARQVWYYVTEMTNSAGPIIPGRYQLRRATKTTDANCYDVYEFWDTVANWKHDTIAENIASFEVWCYGAYQSATGVTYANVPDFNTPSRSALVSPYSYTDLPNRWLYESNKLPVYVEILFTKLEEEAAVKASEMFQVAKAAGGPYTNVQDFVNRNAKRHTIRVNMENQLGYGKNR